MKRFLIAFFLIVLVFTACKRRPPASNMVMEPLFSDHMVLQRSMPVPVWGRADPGGRVEVCINGTRRSATAGRDGVWKAVLPPMEAAGPYELRVCGADTLVFRDVMIGEVWLCSGQSNMEMPLAGWGRIQNFEEEIARAHHPDLRLFQVERALALTPQETVHSRGWERCTPESVELFSSTAYFFGRDLQENLDVPVGLIHSSWGGTFVQTWMSAQALREFPEYTPRLESLSCIQEEYGSDRPIREVFHLVKEKWDREVRSRERGDSGRWYDADLTIDGWKTMTLPDNWENAGLPDLDGIVWFRKEIDLPASWAGRPATLHLPAVDDVDTTWFNGVKVGWTDDWDDPRNYPIPGSLVREGRNVIAVRVIDGQGGGGIWGDPELLFLEGPAGQVLSLASEWRFKVGLDWNEMENPHLQPDNPNVITLCSHAMIDPLVPYALQGAIWYQGEANTGGAYAYRSLFPAMIADWRHRWNRDFPFYFVQLANFMERKELPGEDSWAELREAQLMTLSLPKTGMAVTIDIGDAGDIHPKNKQEVGRRLALIARNRVYGQNVVCSGPMYKSMTVEGSQMRIAFENADGVLKTEDGGPLKGFALAGPDRIFVWADAKIDGNTVRVSHPDIQNPAAVRYAWASNPEGNLVNGAGLPASPFRTDEWPGITAPKVSEN